MKLSKILLFILCQSRDLFVSMFIFLLLTIFSAFLTFSLKKRIFRLFLKEIYYLLALMPCKFHTKFDSIT